MPCSCSFLLLGIDISGSFGWHSIEQEHDTYNFIAEIHSEYASWYVIHSPAFQSVDSKAGVGLSYGMCPGVVIEIAWVRVYTFLLAIYVFKVLLSVSIEMWGMLVDVLFIPLQLNLGFIVGDAVIGLWPSYGMSISCFVELHGCKWSCFLGCKSPWVLILKCVVC